jgi:uncharacterized protein (DUF433 family)
MALGVVAMPKLDRITVNSVVVAGKACIRGLRVTVATILGLMAAGKSGPDILAAYPYLEPEDIQQALEYASWRVQERALSLRRE